MTKIRSGQSFLYRSAGYDSTVIEIRMKEKVTGSYLQVALTDALKRFPYMAQKLVEKDGSYYLHRDDVSMTVAKDPEAPGAGQYEHRLSPDRRNLHRQSSVAKGIHRRSADKEAQKESW